MTVDVFTEDQDGLLEEEKQLMHNKNIEDIETFLDEFQVNVDLSGFYEIPLPPLS